MDFAKVAEQCVVEKIGQGSIFTLRMNISAKNCHLHQAANRYLNL